MSGRPFESSPTRLFAAEINATEWPSPLMAGTMLSPFAATVAPAGWLANAVRGVHAVVPVGRSAQVLRTKMFSTPLVTFDARFVDFVENAIRTPPGQVPVSVVVALHTLTLGFSLKALAGVDAFVVVSGVETSIGLEGVHVGGVVTTTLMHVS